jgi:hypothetical protein
MSRGECLNRLDAGSTPSGNGPKSRFLSLIQAFTDSKWDGNVVTLVSIPPSGYRDTFDLTVNSAGNDAGREGD